MLFNRSREAKTSLLCPTCKDFIHIKRSCHEAYMYCYNCHKTFPLQEFIPKMDDAMEEFLEGLYSNRI